MAARKIRFVFICTSLFRTWTSTYKEMLEGMVSGQEKPPPQITDFKDYNTDKTVKFVITMDQVLPLSLDGFVSQGNLVVAIFRSL